MAQATIKGNGDFVGRAAITANGAPDIAETISTASDVEVYDVVSADPTGNTRGIRSTGAYDSTVIGVISDGSSSFIINSNAGDVNADLNGKLLVLAGRVPVHVTNENGPIVPGDNLTASSTPGYAMKATHAGPTIGKALASFSGTSGSVMTQTNLGYYNPSPTNTIQAASASIGDLNVTGTINSASLNVSGTATINNLQVQTVTVGGNLTVQGLAKVQDIEINGHVITKGDVPTSQILSAAGAGASVAIEGNDSSGTMVFTTGNSPVSGELLKIMFSKDYGAAPRMVFSPSNQNAAGSAIYKGTTTTQDSILNSKDPLSPNTEYKFDYFIVQ